MNNKNMSFINLGRILLFFILSFILYVAIGVMYCESVEPLSKIQIEIAYIYPIPIAIIIAWVVIGRKITMPPTWHESMLCFTEGFFVLLKTKKIVSLQKKILWFSLLSVFFFLLFPPWLGYNYAFGDKPAGKPDFIGFHFFNLHHSTVGGESGYAISVIVRELQLLLIGAVLLIGSIVFFIKRRENNKKR